MTIPIGIDLGTSTSEITAYVNGQCKSFADTTTGIDTVIVPSVVAFDPGCNEIFVGQTAEEFPDCIREAKRAMGTDTYFYSGGKPFKPEEVGAYVLGYLKRIAQEQMYGEDIKDVIVTVPAIFTHKARQATMSAGVIAGLNIVQLIDEPVAAAMYYADANRDKWKSDSILYLVCDFGGGTLDLSLCSKVGNSLGVICTTGDPQLGGKDVDEALITYVQNRFSAENPTSKIQTSREDMMNLLKKACKKCKQQLSNNNNGRVYVPSFAIKSGNAVNLNMTISREEFEEYVMKKSPIPQRKPILERIRETLDNLFNQNNIPKGNIDYLLFVGGSTYIPCVQKLVKDYLGISDDKVFCDEPNLAVSRGAAFFAANTAMFSIMEALEGTSDDFDNTADDNNSNDGGGFENQVIEEQPQDSLKMQANTIGLKPEDLIAVVVRTPYGLGDQSRDFMGNMVYSQWIPPQGQIPFECVFTYKLVYPDQPCVRLKLFQSPYDQDGNKIDSTGIEFTGVEGEINNIPPTYDGSCREIEAHVSINKSGLLHVRYFIPSTGQTLDLEYNPSANVSQASLEDFQTYTRNW